MQTSSGTANPARSVLKSEANTFQPAEESIVTWTTVPCSSISDAYEGAGRTGAAVVDAGGKEEDGDVNSVEVGWLAVFNCSIVLDCKESLCDCRQPANNNVHDSSSKQHKENNRIRRLARITRSPHFC